MIIIEPATPLSDDVAALLRESQSLMESLFPSDENHYLSLEELAAPGVHFFVGRKAGQVVGTAALVEKPGYGEIKSMFVAETARGQGVADAMMRQLEDQARVLKLPMLRLETGNKLNSAARLYARHGFEICDPFGEYSANATSLFMEKPLG